jgi:beta-glucosidase
MAKAERDHVHGTPAPCSGRVLSSTMRHARVSVLVLSLVVAMSCTPTPPKPLHGRVACVGQTELFLVRHQQFLDEGHAAKFDVICLGDSLLFGWDNHRDIWHDHVTDRPTAFWAVGGDATNQLLWRIEHGELDSQSPRVIVVLIGTNNRWVKDDPNDLAQSIRHVAQRIRDKCSAAAILVLGVLPQGRFASDSSRDMFRRTNAILAKSPWPARTTFHDVGDCLLESDSSLADDTSHDGTHLTANGYRRFATQLAPLVARACER